jgi:hypothetical protein
MKSKTDKEICESNDIAFLSEIIMNFRFWQIFYKVSYIINFISIEKFSHLNRNFPTLFNVRNFLFPSSE